MNGGINMTTDYNKDQISQLIHRNNIKTIIISVNDLSNINRSRFVSEEHFMSQVIDHGLGLSSAAFSFDTKGELNSKVGKGYKGGFPSRNIKPDISTFCITPNNSNIARVIADVYDSSDNLVEFTPRNVLKKVIELYKREGIMVKGAFEYEFFIFKNNVDGNLSPISGSKQCFSEVYQKEIISIIEDIMYNLSAIGAGPEIANTEYAPGQFEVTNSPFWGVEIADMAYYFKTIIKETVQQKDLIASFMAKPLANQCGSGAHLHVSLYDADGNNLFMDGNSADGLSEICHNFIAGQIEHANALCCLTNPTVNSYKRFEKYRFAPTSISWGYEHRGAMIRVPNSRDENTRIENKLPGSDTNPYITLSAILAAGLDGIKNKTNLPKPCNGDTTYEDNYDKLPRSLLEALNELKKDTFFRTILGEEFINQYILLRESEWNRYMSHISDWELSEYLQI